MNFYACFHLDLYELLTILCLWMLNLPLKPIWEHVRYVDYLCHFSYTQIYDFFPLLLWRPFFLDCRGQIETSHESSMNIHHFLIAWLNSLSELEILVFRIGFKWGEVDRQISQCGNLFWPHFLWNLIIRIMFNSDSTMGKPVQLELLHGGYVPKMTSNSTQIPFYETSLVHSDGNLLGYKINPIERARLYKKERGQNKCCNIAKWSLRGARTRDQAHFIKILTLHP